MCIYDIPRLRRAHAAKHDRWPLACGRGRTLSAQGLGTISRDRTAGPRNTRRDQHKTTPLVRALVLLIRNGAVRSSRRSVEFNWTRALGRATRDAMMLTFCACVCVYARNVLDTGQCQSVPGVCCAARPGYPWREHKRKHTRIVSERSVRDSVWAESAQHVVESARGARVCSELHVTAVRCVCKSANVVP